DRLGATGCRRLVGIEERLRRRTRGAHRDELAQRSRQFGGRDVDPLPEWLSAHHDVQRHDLDSSMRHKIQRQVCRGVGDDRHTHPRGLSATMLTRFGARTMTLRTTLSASAALILSLASARDCRSSSLMSAATSRRSRTLPWTWTTQVTVSSTSSAGSAFGKATKVNVSGCPSLAQSSSAMCGATGAVRTTSASAASRGTLGSLVKALLNAIRRAMAVLKRRPS